MTSRGDLCALICCGCWLHFGFIWLCWYCLLLYCLDAVDLVVVGSGLLGLRLRLVCVV